MALFEHNPRLIRSLQEPHASLCEDASTNGDASACTRADGGAFPERYAQGADSQLVEDLAALIGESNVLARVVDLVRYASDASPYRKLPSVVVTPRTEQDVARVLKYCSEHERHATFRAAGTSLMGQAQCDDVLIDTRMYFGGVQVLEGGKSVLVRPGAVLAHVNAVLARYGYQLGPDPASAKVSTAGAMIVNNAAGMRCTPERSAYATLRHVRAVLPSGTIIDTRDSDAEEKFAAAQPQLCQELLAIRSEILAQPSMAERIRHKYSIRNTTGYSVRAFLDADTPLQICKKLLVGSEGTLGFVAEAVLETFPIPQATGIWWICLPSTEHSSQLVEKIKALHPAAVEMVRGSSLRSAVAKVANAPRYWLNLPEDCSCLLVEFGGSDLDYLHAVDRHLQNLTAHLPLLAPVELNTSPEFSVMSWTVRSSLMADLVEVKPKGSFSIQEDVCFPLADLAPAVAQLEQLLEKYGYPVCVVGHAAYGNMHFSATPVLSTREGRESYARFMQEFAQLVARHDGSLKSEHGTGINMAPFVEFEWGSDIYELMWRLRRAIDPCEVLGHNVVLSRISDIHMQDFEPEVAVDPLIDGCIECGFCEAVCPSRFLTTTPRQRILIRREMARQHQGSAVQTALLNEFQYDVIDTCAVDSLCEVECPNGIDVGAFVKGMRAEQSTSAFERVGLVAAKKWGMVEKLARSALRGSALIQRKASWKVLNAVTAAMRTFVSTDLMPSVPGPMPQPAKPLPHTNRNTAQIVYFPACVNRIFGRDPDVSDDALSLPEAIVKLGERSGHRVWIPADVAGTCCGTVWASKGSTAGGRYMYAKVVRDILRWSDGGRLPVVVDAASCTYALIHEVPRHIDAELAEQFARVQILDSVQWLKQIVPDLCIEPISATAVIHPGCSVMKLGEEKMLINIAQEVFENVHVPVSSACCGTAGDRGLLHPELVESATRIERSDIECEAEAFLSANRTCEMGLRQHTGHAYESIVYAVEKSSRVSDLNEE